MNGSIEPANDPKVTTPTRATPTVSATTHRDPVLARQEPVEHDHVVLVHCGLFFALLPRDCDIDDKAFLLKPLGEQLGGLPVVLDHEHPHRRLW